MSRPNYRSPRPVAAAKVTKPRYGLARVLSKMGACSRSQAEQWIREGRVSLDGRVERDPQFPTVIDQHRIAVDGIDLRVANHVYVMLNKPRGLIVSATDERGRDTVYTALPKLVCRGWVRSDDWTRPVRDYCCSATTRPGHQRSLIPRPILRRPITSRLLDNRTILSWPKCTQAWMTPAMC